MGACGEAIRLASVDLQGVLSAYPLCPHSPGTGGGSRCGTLAGRPARGARDRPRKKPGEDRQFRHCPLNVKEHR